MTTEVASIRVYKEADGYEKRLPYLGMLNVTFLNEATAYIWGARGVVTRQSYNAALKMLKDLGVSEVQFERRGKIKSITI
jgi:hypothetical protein